MDEKKMAEEFASMNKDLKMLAVCQLSSIHRFDRHINVFNKNVDLMNQNLRMLKKYAKRQNIAILAGIGGFLYLCKKIQKLEDATKKE